MDQSARYADLSLKEEDLIKGGKHILVAYKMKPKAGSRLPGSGRSLRRRVLHRHQRRSLHHRRLHQGRRRAGLLHRRSHRRHADRLSARPVRPQHHRRPHDDRLLPDAGDRQQPGHGRHRARQDPSTSTCPSAPSSCSTARPRTSPTCGASSVARSRTAATSPAPSSSRSWVCVPSRSPAAAYQFWLGGDFIKNDEPQGNQVFCPAKKVYAAGVRRDEARPGRNRPGQAVLRQHHRRRPLRNVRPRRLHPGNLRPRCRQGGLPGRRFRRRPRHDHHRPSSVPQPVPALPPRRPRHDHLAVRQARLHRVRAGQDLASAGCVRHPRRHHGLRQDGRRSTPTRSSPT